MADPPKRNRLKLYEELLQPETRAEMAARDAAAQAEEAKGKKDASLQFKPSHIGKKKSRKPANKPAKNNANAIANANALPNVASAKAMTGPRSDVSLEQHADILSNSSQLPLAAPPKVTQKRGYNDWLAGADDEYQYTGPPKHERGGYKKKKTKGKEMQPQKYSFDDVYNPWVQVPYRAYAKSDAQYDMTEAWKQRLHNAHRRELQRQGKDVKRTYSDEDDRYVESRSRTAPGKQFARPANLNFAPPADFAPDANSRSRSPQRDDAIGSYNDQPRAAFAPSVELNREESAEEAYARRLALSGVASAQQPVARPQPSRTPVPARASLGPAKPLSAADEAKKAKAAAQIAAFKAQMAAKKLSASPAPPPNAVLTPPNTSPAMAHQPPPPPPPPPSDHIVAQGVTISAAPTFNPEYLARKAQQEAGKPKADVPIEDLDEAPEDTDDPDVARSMRPGQAGFAQRMMEKMGYQKGKGLGAHGDGITTAIVAQKQKRSKLPDAAGGGFATPANMAKLVGGKKGKPDPADKTSTDETPVQWSDVVKLEGMLANLDVDLEIQNNNILQEIGNEMGKYGHVERLFIWRDHMGGNDEVFVKFTSPTSAFNAVKGMDGVEFGDNQVKAQHWDAGKFEREEYS